MTWKEKDSPSLCVVVVLCVCGGLWFGGWFFVCGVFLDFSVFTIMARVCGVQTRCSAAARVATQIRVCELFHDINFIFSSHINSPNQ